MSHLDTTLDAAPVRDAAFYDSFRQELHDFMRAHCPAPLRAKVRSNQKLGREDMSQWQQILHAHGWGAPSWPKSVGGTGWDLQQRYLVGPEPAQGVGKLRQTRLAAGYAGEFGGQPCLARQSLLGEQGATTADAGLHLIEDQFGFVFFSQRGNASEKIRFGNLNSTHPLNSFNDDSCDGIGLQRFFYRINITPRKDVEVFSSIARSDDFRVVGQCHSSGSSAMESA